MPSAVQSEPSPQWAAPLGRAPRIVRAALSEQNLPGLSVAVGIGRDIVWAEGFGWADVETGALVTPGDLLGATVMTVLTVHQRGIVVAAMSNITSADTSAMGRKVGEALAR